MNDTTDPGRLKPLADMAAEIGVRPCDLRADAIAGNMPHVCVGKSGLLFDPERVLAVLAERARQGTPLPEEHRDDR